MTYRSVWGVGLLGAALVAAPAATPGEATAASEAIVPAEEELYLVVSISERVVRVFRGDE
jgi:hypothetical protein